MKKIRFITSTVLALASLSGLLCSCEKIGGADGSVPAEVIASEGNKVTFFFEADGETKANSTATTAEKSVNKIYVYAFKGTEGTALLEGDPVEATASGGAYRATLTLTNGQKTFRAIANVDTAPTVTTLAGFDKATSDLAGNTPSKLVMVAKATENITRDMTVNMSLERLASKICVTSIKRQYTDAAAGELQLHIDDIWINNVAGTINLDGTPVGSPSVWYNKIAGATARDAAVESILHSTVNIDLVNNATWTGGADVPHYIYSNASTLTTEGGVWSPRVSRLVIGCHIAGTDTQKYYSCNLPQTDPNKVYNVDLTLKAIPSNSPDNPGHEDPINLAVVASISVSDWGTVIPVPITIGD